MKKFIIALMAFCLVFSLTGCGGGGGGGGGEVQHWGDEGANLPDKIKANYENMKKAFVSTTINSIKDKNQLETHVENYFTKHVSPTATFMNNNTYNKAKMTTRLRDVFTYYKVVDDGYTCKPGETKKISDTKYTSWCYCAFKTTRNKSNPNDTLQRTWGGWIQFTWEKSGDDWFITKGFDNKAWFEDPDN